MNYLADFVAALGAFGDLIVAFFTVLLGVEFVRFIVHLVLNGGRS